MLESLKDLLAPAPKTNEIFLEKNMNKIKGRIYRVSASGLEDIKFEIRNDKALVTINEGYKIRIRGLRNDCLFNCIGEKTKALLDELNKTPSCVQRTFFGKIKIQSFNGGAEASMRKIKIWRSDFQLEITFPIDFRNDIENIRTMVLSVLSVTEKLDFYVSLI